MNGITFKREEGGLARTLASETHISGLIVYGEGDFNIQLITSVLIAESFGVSFENTPVLHYHLSEFFRINEGASLYIQGVAVSDGDYTEAKIMQNYAQGSIRQFAICDFKTPITETNDINSLETATGKLQQIADGFWESNTPAIFLLSVKIASTDIALLPDLHTYSNQNVSVVIGQDTAGRGNFISTTNTSISCIGTVLGTVSKANVNESIAWVEKQNLVTTYPYDEDYTGNVTVARELDSIGFCDASKISEYTLAQLNALNDKGYLFGFKHTGITGTYMNDSFTATSLDSDYAYIENVRTISEAIRNINTVLIPKISGPVRVNPDTGYLSTTSVSSLEGFCEEALDKMVRNGEISGYSVYIDEKQKVLSTSKLAVVLKIVPIGTLRQIEVSIGLTLKTT